MSPEKSPYKALEKFSKAVYGTTGGTCSARDFRPLMGHWGEFFISIRLKI